MRVEVLDGRYAGKIRDIDDSVVPDLIKQGRARKLTGPTPAAPILPGGYRGTTSEPQETLDCVSQGTSKISFPVAKPKKIR